MPQTNKGIYTCMYRHLSFILTWKKNHRYHKMLLIMLIKFNKITIHRIQNKAKIIIIKNYRL